MADLDSREILATAFAQDHTHDFQLFKHRRCFPVRSTRVLADAGYQGLAEIHPNSQTPTKKTKLHPLAIEQKRRNREVGRKRILIEHIIRQLKIFRMLSERYRNRRKRFGRRFNLIAAVYNMEVKNAR